MIFLQRREKEELEEGKLNHFTDNHYLRRVVFYEWPRCLLACVQCDQIRRLLKVLDNKFSDKSSQNIRILFRLV